MFIACAVLSVILAVVLVGSAGAKLTRQPKLVDGLTAIGVPGDWLPKLAACEIAGGIGLVVGLAIAPIGIAAAVGVVLYFIGAVFFHLRAGDRAGAGAPAVFLVLAVVVLALRLATLPA